MNGDGHKETPPPGVARHRAMLRRRWQVTYALAGVVLGSVAVILVVAGLQAGNGWWVAAGVVPAVLAFATGAAIPAWGRYPDEVFDVLHNTISAFWRPWGRS